MRNNCTIAIKTSANVMSISCKLGGHPCEVGKILLETYNTTEKIYDLMRLGDLFYLGNNLNPNPNKPHTIENEQPDTTIAYGRDLGQDNCNILIYQNQKELMEYRYNDYNYIYKNNKWYYNSYLNPTWKELTKEVTTA